MTDGWDGGLLGPDPVPGNPGWVSGQANQLRTIGEDAGRSLTSLRGIHSQLAGAAWKGVAADAFAKTVQEVVLSDLGKLHDSYGGAGDALRAFGERMTQLQGEAAQLLAQARKAAADRDSANAGIQSQSQAKSDAEWGAGVADGEIAGLVTDVEWRITASGADPVAIWEAGRHVPIVASEGEAAVRRGHLVDQLGAAGHRRECRHGRIDRVVGPIDRQLRPTAQRSSGCGRRRIPAARQLPAGAGRRPGPDRFAEAAGRRPPPGPVPAGGEDGRRQARRCGRGRDSTIRRSSSGTSTTWGSGCGTPASSNSRPSSGRSTTTRFRWWLRPTSSAMPRGTRPRSTT